MSSLPTSLRFAFSFAHPSIRGALSRTKHETVKRQLENCHLVAGIRFNGLTIREIQVLRGLLPDYAKLVVVKNSQIEKAIEGTPWESLKSCARGMNAWLFVHDGEIPGALKPYRDIQKAWNLEFNDFTGGVFEGRLYGPEEFVALETMPTRMEIYAYLLGCLQTPAASIVGTLQASENDLVANLNSNVKDMEEGDEVAAL